MTVAATLPMTFESIRQFLLPGNAEKDEGFREEVLRLSHLGLEVIGWVTIGASLFLALARVILHVESEHLAFRMLASGAAALIGAVMLLLARVRQLYAWSRLLASLAGLVICAILVNSALYLARFDAAAEHFIPAQITLTIFLGVASIPFQPLHTLAFGVGTACVYVASLDAFAIRAEPAYLLFLATVTLLATAVSAQRYSQRYRTYQAFLQILRSTDELRDVQNRLSRSENASSMTRLAAAISHEVNNPVGALLSGVDTLLLLAARQASSPAEQQARLVKLQSDLRRSIQESARRLQQVAARMARFTNLDHAEVLETNVNDLLGDVAALLKPNLKNQSALQLDLQATPSLVCNPQQLSAVFYDLMNNSVAAIGDHGRVVVRTRRGDGTIDVQFEDNGSGLDPESLKTIFDPVFRVADGRVGTGNWSMFNARQVIREQGGDIAIRSTLGEGTVVSVLLPVPETL